MHRLIASLRIFISGAWQSYIALFYWTQPATYVMSKIIAPLTLMLFFTCLGMSATGRDTAEFYIVGNALQLTAYNGIFGVTMTIGHERNVGTLIYLIGSPANRLVIFLGRAFFNILDGMLGVVMGFAWGMLLGLDLSAANLPGLALTIAITTISTCGVGLLMGSIGLAALNVTLINNTVFFLLLVFSGANLPLEKMPTWIQAVSTGLPLTRGIQSARLLVTGVPLAAVWPLLAGELAVGLAYALAGFTFFRWFEFQARKRGTLEAI
ncbi:MAG: ABC transporter permease [Chloroflexota bacterium]|nr:ABC transporter permease [Chloroflexota bacterium]